MNAKVKKAYNGVVDSINEHAGALSRPQYEEFVGELLAHLKSLQDCIDEESTEEGG